MKRKLSFAEVVAIDTVITDLESKIIDEITAVQYVASIANISEYKAFGMIMTVICN